MKKTCYTKCITFWVVVLVVAAGVSTAFAQTETTRLNTFTDDTTYLAYLASYGLNLGDDTSVINTRFRDYTDAADIRVGQIYQIARQQLRSDFDYNLLNTQGKLTYKLFEKYIELQIDFYNFRYQQYAVHHKGGAYESLPNYLMNYVSASSFNGAQQYLLLLEDIERVLDQILLNIQIREDRGVHLPKSIYPLILVTAQNLSNGFPIQPGASENNLIYADFMNKVNGSNALSQAQRTSLIQQCRQVLTESYGPAYQRFIQFLNSRETTAPEAVGVGSFPNGDAYYKMMLEYRTTTKMSAKKVHKTGLRHVKRIHREMKQVMEDVNFKGETLQEFFEFMRTKNKFYYKNTNSGRNQCLREVRKMLDTMNDNIPLLFSRWPNSPLEVVRVEEYREQSSGIAFYSSGSADGSRPGRYFLNLYDMKNQPKFEMQSLSYHEGIPGHHFQVMLHRESDFGSYYRNNIASHTAFVEGWALYAEEMTEEIDMYKNPYDWYGMLSNELWRACRLVVDTGIHDKGWTRQQAIDYLVENTSTSEEGCAAAIDRYAVLPAQATAYMIGKLKILKIRKNAEKKLGDDFSVINFHDNLLVNGSLPLDVVEDVMKDWWNAGGTAVTVAGIKPSSRKALPDWLRRHIILTRMEQADRLDIP